ncbi:citrate lyase holo-[acyl-carrier protein] synthase [Mobilicoccus massiliensis]|uniref:citrate lyase holo-[acyl-carrier protein] synthase n=1 Tax=Mobilicoccus massiliensis TaxID=1522310 RepID=UPI000693AC6B|nr:citrate lyase holo-[acyl-carrier protein] synthase [Mobilicoccus massiliensis]
MTSPTVSVEDMLAARDTRAARQRALAARFGARETGEPQALASKTPASGAEAPEAEASEAEASEAEASGAEASDTGRLDASHEPLEQASPPRSGPTQAVAPGSGSRDTGRDGLFERKVAVVSITLVVPGPDKNPAWSRRVFDAAMTAAVEACTTTDDGTRCTDTSLLHREAHDLATGAQGYLVVAMEPLEAKRRLVAAEDTHPWGRLFDLDVVVRDVPIQRADLGASPRRCLVCDGPAAPCSRSRAHDVAELFAAIDRVLS